MEHHYFECYWTIIDFIGFGILDNVMPIVNRLQCEMWWSSWNNIHQTKDGYEAVSCIVQAPSVDVFSTLAKEIERYLPLTDCHSISSPDLPVDDSLGAPANTVLVDLIQNLNQIAEYNQAVLHKTPMWVSGIWIVKPIKVDDVDHLLQISAEKNCSLFYKSPFRPYSGSPIWMIAFFLQVNQVDLFDVFSKQLGQVFDARHWSWIYKNSSIELDLEKLSPLTHETVNEFIQLIQRISD